MNYGNDVTVKGEYQGLLRNGGIILYPDCGGDYTNLSVLKFTELYNLPPFQKGQFYFMIISKTKQF